VLPSCCSSASTKQTLTPGPSSTSTLCSRAGPPCTRGSRHGLSAR
jgi:hypothetical protein